MIPARELHESPCTFSGAICLGRGKLKLGYTHRYKDHNQINILDL